MDGGYEGGRCDGLLSGLRSEDYFERLQALSALFEILTFDSTAIFEYARPIPFVSLLVPLLELDRSGGDGGWELGGEVSFQAARCLGFYLEATPEIASELIVRLGGAQHLVRWLESFEQIEFAETAITTLSLIVKEQRLALIGDVLDSSKQPCDDMSCSDESRSVAGENVNPITAILNIIDFLPLETQKKALELTIKGSTHLPPKYWPLLVESMSVISALVGTYDGEKVTMGLHAKSVLKLCCVALRSICCPRGEVRDGISKPVSSQLLVDELVSKMSEGLLEMSIALLASNTDVDIMYNVVNILTLFVQNSNKLREMMATTSLLQHTSTFLSKLAKHTPHSSDLMTSTMVLMDELLMTEVGHVREAGSIVKVSDGKGVRVFGGSDGRGTISQLEYGSTVFLMLSWVSDNGTPRHLVGIPPPLEEQSKEISPKLASLDGKKEAVAVLGWVFGNPFTSNSHFKADIKHEQMPTNLVSLICDCVNMSERVVEPVPVLALSLLGRVIDKMEKVEVFEGSDEVSAMLGAALTINSPHTSLQAIKLIKHMIFDHNSDLREDHLIRCQSLERHGVWSRLSVLCNEVEVTDSSLISLVSMEKVRAEAVELMGMVKFFKPDLNPLTKCCECLLAHIVESTDKPTGRCSDEVETALCDLLSLASSVTPHEWNSSSATQTLITYFSTIQTDSNSSVEVNLSLEQLKRSRVISFLRVISKVGIFIDLVSLLHRCLTEEALASCAFEVVLSKAMGGNPPPVTPPDLTSEPAPKGRIAKRLAELGALTSGLSPVKTSQEGQEKEAGEESVVVGEVGLKAALSLLNQPLQLITKMNWINSKRRGTRRGRGMTHGIPMLMEATTVLGSLIEYALCTACDLGLGIETDSQVSMAVVVMVAGINIGNFRLTYSGDASGRPQLKCEDDSSSVSVLHALYGAYREANKQDESGDNDSPLGIEMHASAPSFKLWEMTHSIEIIINCEGILPDTIVPTACVSSTKGQLSKEGSNTFHETFGHFLSPITDGVEAKLIGSPVVTDILILLRLFRASVDAYDVFSKDLDSLFNDSMKPLFPPPSAWTNKYISQQFIKQLSDPIVLSCVSARSESAGLRPSSLPGWICLVARFTPFCLPLEVRSRYMHSTMFGSSHALRSLHRYDRKELDMCSKREREEMSPPAASKIMISINREAELGILKGAMRGYREAKHRPERHQIESLIEGGEEWDKGLQLEATFEGEAGSGVGPTAEFFSLFSRSLASVPTSRPLWRGQSDEEGLRTFFPWPLANITENLKEEESFSHLELMGCLGWILMQSLQDGYLIDLPLALPLLLLLSNDNTSHPLLSSRQSAMFHLNNIDPELSKQLKQLSELAHIFNTSESGDEEDPIEAMCLDWTLPGRPDVSLKGDGFTFTDEFVTCKTFSLWMDRVLETSLLEGTSLIDSLRQGARLVGDPNMLSCFTPLELESLLLGDVSSDGRLPLGNDSKYIIDAIDCAHGYTHDSPAVLALVDVLTEFNLQDQTAFIQFVTGCPRLPLGGLTSLVPRLTVVRKRTSSECLELPSASTCTNYLKLPDYGSIETLKARLLVAIHEGQGAFLLS